MNAKLKQLRQEKGFTIIEVMIVLAIAALIMLIVFLAVPALQRSSRNTQRNADASKVASAVEECLSNHNNLPASCDTTGEVGIDTSSLSQLSTYSFTAVGSVVPGSYTNNNANVILGGKCSAAGDSVSAGNATQVAVIFQIETGSGNSNRCIGG